MPSIIPNKTVSEIKQELVSSFEAISGQSISLEQRSVLNVLLDVEAARTKLFYLLLKELEKNTWYTEAYSETQGGTLQVFGRSKLRRDPFPATQGSYLVQINASAGQLLPAGTTFKTDVNSSKPNLTFQLDTDYTTVSGLQNITLRGLNYGSSSSISVGDKLLLTSPVFGVDTISEVVSVISQPIDAEDLEDYRDKIDASFKIEPQGGSNADYIVWPIGVVGFRRTYPYKKTGTCNEVDLYIEAIESASVNGDFIPTQQILDEVKSAIEPDKKPSTAVINYLPIIPNTVNIEIENLLYNNAAASQDVKDLIFSTIKGYLYDIRPYIPGISEYYPKNDFLKQSAIIAEIQKADSLISFDSVTIDIDANTNVISYQFENGNLPYLPIGGVTYV